VHSRELAVSLYWPCTHRTKHRLAETKADLRENVPAGQGVQRVVLRPSEYVFGGHSVQLSALAAATTCEALPAAHWRHCELEVLPGNTPCVPAAQGSQVFSEVARVLPEYDPKTHGIQSVWVVAPSALENVPAGHSWHCEGATAAVRLENVPGGQSVQAGAPSYE